MDPRYVCKCGYEMTRLGEIKFNLEEVGNLLADFTQSFQRDMYAEVYICPVCKKLEFYAPTLQY